MVVDTPFQKSDITIHYFFNLSTLNRKVKSLTFLKVRDKKPAS